MGWSPHVSVIAGRAGQTIDFYPPSAEVIADGAPTSAATYRVFKGDASNDDAPEIASSSATLDTVSTTISAAAGYSQTNRRSITLTSGTGVVVGRRYVLTNASGQREIVIPSAVNGTAVTAEEPLAFDYATNATFIGLRHVFTLSSANVGTDKINVWGISPNLDAPASTTTRSPPYRVEWQYSTAGGVPRTSWTTYDVCRQPFKILLSLADVKPLLPDIIWEEWTQQRGQDFEPQIEEASQMVHLDLVAAGFDPDAIRDPFTLTQLGKAAFLVVVARAGIPMPNDQTVADVERRYSTLFEKHVGTTLRAWLDTGTTGAITPEPARQMWLRGR